MSSPDPFGAQATLSCAGKTFVYSRLRALEERHGVNLDRLPFSIRVLLENLLRQCAAGEVDPAEVLRLARWSARPETQEIPYLPARVVLQDFTGVPVVVDLVAMRDAVHERGGDPARVNPIVPVDLVIDHSLQVDYFGAPEAERLNTQKEFERNRERYLLLRWAQQAFRQFRAVPPGAGIIHQVNLEYLATVVAVREEGGRLFAFPDTVVGTDSHTTMINALGVLGWGVGGIEAEAVMLGQPYAMLAPEVTGVRLSGRLAPGVTSTDLVLAVTERLRKKGVVGKFVEYFGPGLANLTVEDRATLANMAPEYGATMGFFPVDARTIEYLRFTGRPGETAELAERYCREQKLFREPESPDPEYSDTVEMDLAEVTPNLAGPKRPQDRVALREMKSRFRASLAAPVKERGFALGEADLGRAATLKTSEGEEALRHGAVVIAAITSCTNTSNPALMLAAGLLAKKAVARGLSVKPHVKTSLAPGSRVVTDYLRRSGLLESLERLRFHVAGYGCTTCIGNSGPLPEPVARAIEEGRLVAASVLSGNRNFEARVHPQVKANYLASPPLVVAYAIAGTVDVDLETEPLGRDTQGRPVYLREIWPTPEEIQSALRESLRPEMFRERYAAIFEGGEEWRALEIPRAAIYQWDADSTYIQRPPYFDAMPATPPPLAALSGLRALALFGDSVTTDHISPAGSIAAKSPAGQYLQARGVAPADFNTYGARRGNHEVMIRGTFANIRIKNLLLGGEEGGYTIHFPTGERLTIYDAARRYAADGTPLLVIAGREYGTGSSRDWAAKGTALLGVRAVLAESFERIHRGNLAGMGVLPLQFLEGENAERLGLPGREVFDIEGLETLAPRAVLGIRARAENGGGERIFRALARIDPPADREILRHGGILPMMARKLTASA